MTSKKALAEAVRRWGRKGAVEKRAGDKNPSTRCSVGFIALGMFFEVKGQGPTWEVAFEDAAKKEKR